MATRNEDRAALLAAYRNRRRLARLREQRQAVTAALAGPVEVEGVVAVEGTPTGDGRMMDDGSLRWTDDPIPIIWDRDDNDHDGVILGAFTSLQRRKDGTIYGVGALSETDDPDTAKLITRATELIRDGAIQFSVRLDEVSEELRVSAEAVERMEAEEAAQIERMLAENEDDLPEPETDDEGRIVVARMRHDDMLQVTVDARIRHVAMVDTAAFIDARPKTASYRPHDNREVLTAAAVAELQQARIVGEQQIEVSSPEVVTAAVTVPTLKATHFPAPEDRWQSADPQPLSIEPDGHLWGHVAQRHVCHRSGRPEDCMTYSDDVDPDLKGFHTSTKVRLDDGRTIRVGAITMEGNHAGRHMTAEQRLRHHESTSTVAALVTAWEDRHGLAVSGTMVDGLSDRQLQQFMGAAPSVELWPHEKRAGLTLLGIHMVPAPAWPVAASVVDPDREGDGVTLVAGPCMDGCRCPEHDTAV